MNLNLSIKFGKLLLCGTESDKISRGQDRRKMICLTKNGYFSDADFVLSSYIGWCTQGSNRIVGLVQSADKICVPAVIVAIPKFCSSSLKGRPPVTL